ncbi:hypothetical protein PTSG_10601 [Salpingoeca rosetta]|uniref:Phytocyanin domain-containing protein n=1 Tax=Salpingoeca rosetta (strain ATCC 50818 / BSB-021) TaxID=946362 RepID=F2URU3_SALR5|nr:uncharacterized protein PTSG_10601 [Salpingoeca rosetta]EGD80348.1 hypothetical protein PTSG_10601 [Salpingoeca rosetta]|eukprot:XP_004988138.1 hypothetical protein PTSG_10601 [Salpingoeca rosetta]
MSVFVLLVLVVLVAAVLAGTTSAQEEVETVLWQFQREDGQFLSGQALQDALGPLTVEQGTIVRFRWEPYGFAHGLFQVTNQNDFDNCNLVGTELVARSTRGDYNATLDPGTYFFVGGVGSNCETGMKVRVTVLEQGETVPPTVMTTTPIPAIESDLAKVVVVDWEYNVPKPDVEANQDDIIQFRWSGSISSSVRRVTQENYEACNFNNPLEIVSESTTSNVVNVTGLDVGRHYFISAEITHCSSAHMSVAVNIVPRLIRYWITLYPSDVSSTTDSSVSLTLTGYDSELRVWTSPATIVNEATTGSGDSVALDISAEEAHTFEIVARDVGTPIAVRMSAVPGSGFAPSRVRVRARAEDLDDGDARESKTFTCSRPEGGDVDGVSAINCIVPADGSTSTPPPTSTNTTQQERDCECFRQLLAHHPSQRVLACSKDGCFATVDDGTAGWSTLPAIRSLIGTGTDSRLFAVSPTNATLASIDGGLTWQEVTETSTIATPATVFSDPLFEGSGDTPLDRHVQTSSSAAADWGITRKGVLVNTAGTWAFRALWSCTCDGSCGLKCDQPLF